MFTLTGEVARKKACSVPGCEDKLHKRHRFPKNDRDMFNTWLVNVNNGKLLAMTMEEVYRSYVICERHFENKFIAPGTKRGITINAVPTLFLPGDQADHVLNEPLQDVSMEVVHDMPSKKRGIHELFEDVMSPEAVPSGGHKRFTRSSIEDVQFEVGSSVIDTVQSINPELIVEQPADNEPKTPDTSPRRKSPTFLAMSKGLKKRRSILKDLNVTRQQHLTPRCKKLYNKVVGWANKNAKLYGRVKNFRERLAHAEKLAESPNFENLMNHVNEITYKFILQQVRTQKLPPKGRRFTLSDKLLALSFLKAGGKGYRMLSKVFTLPTKRTLTNLLNKLPFRPGINDQIFETLKNSVTKMMDVEKCCVLMFDKISIESTLFYNRKDDCIEGIEDLGDRRHPKLVDHCNVFMLKGVYRQWKQPLEFTFSCGPSRSIFLREEMVRIIKLCQDIGLKVVATVCDQGSGNQAAINSLVSAHASEGDKSTFLINNEEVVPLFDVPHLFKGIRNNLLNKDLHFQMNNQTKIGKWSDVVDFYQLDASDETRMCPKLTDGHVIPSKINKMKVSCCTQVFSHQVGSLMKRISKWGIQDEHTLQKSASDTADLILFLDKLFDSLNTNCKIAPASKPLKGGVTASSGHIEFWYEAIKVLKSMKFFVPQKNQYLSVPSIKNLIKTVYSFIYLSQKLLKNNFTYILTRAFNQDPLENFFASIRSHGRRNTSRNAVQFMSSFKALLVSSFMSSHSPSSNCEEDSSVGALDSLQHLLTENVKTAIEGNNSTETIAESADIFIPEHVTRKKSRVSDATVTYIAGYVAKKALKSTNNCHVCKELLVNRGEEKGCAMDFIEARQYECSTLIKPGGFLTFLLKQSLPKLFYLIPRVCHKMKLKHLLMKTILKEVDFRPIICHQHKDLDKILCHHIITCLLFFWTKRVNLIVRGKDSKFLHYIKKYSASSVNDPIKLMAHKKFCSKSKCKK